jgi:hypothetical protein
VAKLPRVAKIIILKVEIQSKCNHGKDRKHIIQIMSAPESASATYKQPSRKGKKAWRKNVDVTQIQGGLEEVRDQIIQG